MSYRRDIYIKIKLRTSTIQYQPKKERIFAKKNIFLKFFWFSRHARGLPEIFDVQFFENFKKKIQKWLYWDLSNIERNKVMNFGEPSPNPMERADHFWSSGHNVPPLRWNRVKILGAMKVMLKKNQITIFSFHLLASLPNFVYQSFMTRNHHF